MLSMQSNIENQDWESKEDSLFDKFCDLTTGGLNRSANIDWEARTAKTDYKARNKKIDWEARTKNRDYKSSIAKTVAKTDYKAVAAKKDWKSIVAKTDYEARNKKLMKPISQFDLQGNFIRDWDSATQAEKSFNSNNKTITQCCRGRQKTSFGFIWKYKSEQN